VWVGCVCVCVCVVCVWCGVCVCGVCVCVCVCVSCVWCVCVYIHLIREAQERVNCKATANLMMNSVSFKNSIKF